MPDLPISGLPVGTAATGGPIPTVQGGATVKITATAAGAAMFEAASAAAQAALIGFTAGVGVVGAAIAATGSTAAGGLLYTSALDTPAFLAAGTNGQVLAMVAGAPAWANVSAVGIGGSIAANQVAYGSGANTIQGSAGFTFDGTTLTFPGDLVYASATATIRANTSDAADTSRLDLCGGGAALTTRGAVIRLEGNESGTPGRLTLFAGQVGTASVDVNTAGVTSASFNSDSQLSMTSGSATLPAYTFMGDENTGVYGIGADTIGVTTGGTLRWDVSTTAITSTLQMLSASGSAGAPTYSYSGDPDTGIYNRAANTLTLVTNGTLRLDMTATQLTMSLPNVHTMPAGSGTQVPLYNAATALHVALTASTEYNYFRFGSTGAPTQQFATGAITTQRFAVVEAPTYAFVGASTITDAATFAITAAPTAGTNATITNPMALWVQAGQVFIAGAGTVSKPILAVGEVDSGLYLVAADQLGLATNGTLRATFKINTCDFTTAVHTSAGSASTPAHGFTGDGNTGMYSVGADDLGFATGGTLRFDISTTAVTSTLQILAPGATNEAAPAYAFAGATDLGLAKTGATAIGLVRNGTAMLTISSTGVTISNVVTMSGGSATSILRNGTGTFQFGCSNAAGTLEIQSGGSAMLTFATNTMATFTCPLVVTPPASTGSPQRAFTVNAAAHTALTASTEYTSFRYVGATQQFATGALTTNRFAVVTAPTYAFVAASTLTDAATLAIEGAPIAGTNATITNPYALWVQAGMTNLAGGVRVGNFAASAHAISAGASGTNYGSVGYNVAYTAVSGVDNYLVTDSASRVYFTAGTVVLQAAASGTAGNAITWTTGLTVSTSTVTAALPVLIPVGSAGAPGIAFSGDTNTGMWSANPDNIQFSVGGAEIFSLSGTSITAFTTLFHANGSATTPSINFTNDNDCGLYRIGANNIGFAAGGALTFDYSTTLVKLASGIDLQLGNAYVATPQVPTGYIVIKDSTGTSYKVSVNV